MMKAIFVLFGFSVLVSCSDTVQIEALPKPLPVQPAEVENPIDAEIAEDRFDPTLENMVIVDEETGNLSLTPEARDYFDELRIQHENGENLFEALENILSLTSLESGVSTQLSFFVYDSFTDVVFRSKLLDEQSALQVLDSELAEESGELSLEVAAEIARIEAENFRKIHDLEIAIKQAERNWKASKPATKFGRVFLQSKKEKENEVNAESKLLALQNELKELQEQISSIACENLNPVCERMAEIKTIRKSIARRNLDIFQDLQTYELPL